MTEEDFKKYGKSYRQYYGENYDKALENLRLTEKSLRDDFLQKYPNANIELFSFNVTLSKSGDVTGTSVSFKVRDEQFLDITTNAFKELYSGELYWSPRIWGTTGTVQPFVKNSSSVDVNSFKIYVADDLFFNANLPKLEIRNNESSNDYKDNPYLAALFAAYIATYSCGISEEHFNYDGSKIISSIARYHLYFHMRRFIRQPRKMSKYITQEIETTVLNNKPVVYKWTKEFHSGREQLSYWISKQPRGTIKDARVVMSRNNTGQIGISYMKRGAQTVRGLDDYKLFIASKSNGLTKTGQLLFQESIESFVYCVLGSQANTRWPIVGRGAMSSQTQEVFKKLVNDTIIQSDHTVTISNMRKAIKDTNVVLNMVISPGIILIPSNLIILDKMVPGYNNVLKLATKGMRFGKNDDVNYSGPTPASTGPSRVPTPASTGPSRVPTPASTGPTSVNTRPKPASTGPSPVRSEPKMNESELILLVITAAGGTLISKFLI